MTDSRLTPEEQAFLAETGLRPDDLAPLVADAPPLPADALDRIRRRAREKAGIDGGSGLPAAVPVPEAGAAPARAFRRRTGRWLAAAAAALLLTAATAALAYPEQAVAAIERLVRLVPGIGLTETDGETWVLPEPVTVERDGVRVTVEGFVSDPEGARLQLRVRWPPPAEPVKAVTDRAADPPELRLPDGTAVQRRTGYLAGGSTVMVGSYDYGALPAGTRAVVVVLPYLAGTSGPVEVPLTLVNAAEAGLAEGRPGDWSEENRGIQVGVSHWAAADDRIVLSLDARLPDGTTVTGYRQWVSPGRWVEPQLTDDRGRTYPLSDFESQLSVTQGRAVFWGPLAPDATRLTFTVPYLQLTDYDAEARLTVPLDQLPEGQPLRLDQELQLGRVRFTVRTVTRLDEDTFRFSLDLGTEEDGVLLETVSVRPPILGNGPTGWSAEGNADTGQMVLDVDYRRPPSRTLQIVFSWPRYRVRGDWQVELPVPGERSRDE